MTLPGTRRTHPTLGAMALALALTTLAGRSFAASPMVDVFVSRSRVHVGDLVAGLSPEAAAIDAGPSPAAGGSRIVDRSEIVVALREHGVAEPLHLPGQVRVARKMKRLEVKDVEQIVRTGLGTKLPAGVTLNAVHPPGSVNVPDGYTGVVVEMARPPHRTGPVSSDARVTFNEDSLTLWTLIIPVDLLLGPEAAVPDVRHGSGITLVIRRGLVEVSAGGSTAADADLGEVVPVVVRSSGRTILARLEDRDHAVAIESP